MAKQSEPDRRLLDQTVGDIQARIGWAAEAAGDAIGDIRRKLVEEGWFGQAVTDRDEPTSPALDLGVKDVKLSVLLGWDMTDEERTQRTQARSEEQGPIREHGIDI